MVNEIRRWYRTNLNSRPWITILFAAVCIVVFLLTLPELSYYSNGLNIISRFSTSGYYVFGYHQYYRLITAGFVHLSWLHIGMNMYVLWQLGSRLEDQMGHARYFLLLICSILLGNLSVCLLSPYSSAAGISTGLYGLMVCDIVHLAKTYGFKTVLNAPGIRYTIIVNLILNFLPGISWQGHFGGTIAGLLFGLFS